MTTGEWTGCNLATQGYCLPDAERRSLWLGLRFSTGVCPALVVTALALESAPALARWERRTARKEAIAA